jgi:SAM-dependent methyltransferase
MLRGLALRCPGVPAHAADFNRLDGLGGLEGLGDLGQRGRFDGVISTFAGLNAARDLTSFSTSAARLLRPGGILFVHLLNRWPLADLGRSLRGGPARFGRTLSASLRGVRMARFGGLQVPHFLRSPRGLYARVFARDFALLRAAGQGIVRPIDEPLLPVGASDARIRWERALAVRPLLRACGTFFTLELARREPGPSLLEERS